jgi:hypothetical protein
MEQRQNIRIIMSRITAAGSALSVDPAEMVGDLLFDNTLRPLTRGLSPRGFVQLLGWYHPGVQMIFSTSLWMPCFTCRSCSIYR